MSPRIPSLPPFVSFQTNAAGLLAPSPPRLQDPTDPISYVCAWLALVPQGLCVAYATLVWSTREAEIALMFAGQLGCEALNFALKRLIKEERPSRMNGKGYGMPSSHAQFAAYFAVSVALFLLVRHSPPPSPPPSSRSDSGRKPIRNHNHTPMSRLERVAWSALALLVAAAVAWSRIYLNYHTPRQVVAGCTAGAFSAVIWFAITEAARRTGLLAWAINLPPARWLRVRDLAVEEDPCQAGWEKWDGRRAARRAEEERRRLKDGKEKEK